MLRSERLAIEQPPKLIKASFDTNTLYGITAMIAEFSVDSITEKISKLVENKKMRDKLSANLCKEKISNEEEVKAFEALLR